MPRHYTSSMHAAAPKSARHHSVFASTALAQPQPAGASAEADTLFDEGRMAMDAGDFKVACKAFDASQKLSPAVSMIGGAIALDLWARDDYAKALETEYDPAQEDLWNKAKTKRYIAQGVAAGGVAAIAVGVWLFVKNVKYERENGFAQATSLHVEPALAWDHVGVQVFRAF